MYNNIGLLTPRGSGTSGHVQRNDFGLGGPRQDTLGKPRNEAQNILQNEDLKRKSNLEILDHNKRRKIEAQIIALQDELEEQGLPEDEIELRCQELRGQLLTQENVGADIGMLKNRSLTDAGRHVHERSIAQAAGADRFKLALGIDQMNKYSLKEHNSLKSQSGFGLPPPPPLLGKKPKNIDQSDASSSSDSSDESSSSSSDESSSSSGSESDSSSASGSSGAERKTKRQKTKAEARQTSKVDRAQLPHSTKVQTSEALPPPPVTHTLPGLEQRAGRPSDKWQHDKYESQHKAEHLARDEHGRSGRGQRAEREERRRGDVGHGRHMSPPQDTEKRRKGLVEKLAHDNDRRQHEARDVDRRGRPREQHRQKQVPKDRPASKDEDSWPQKQGLHGERKVKAEHKPRHTTHRHDSHDTSTDSSEGGRGPPPKYVMDRADLQARNPRHASTVQDMEVDEQAARQLVQSAHAAAAGRKPSSPLHAGQRGQATPSTSEDGLDNGVQGEDVGDEQLQVARLTAYKAKVRRDFERARAQEREESPGSNLSDRWVPDDVADPWGGGAPKTHEKHGRRTQPFSSQPSPKALRARDGEARRVPLKSKDKHVERSQADAAQNGAMHSTPSRGKGEEADHVERNTQAASRDAGGNEDRPQVPGKGAELQALMEKDAHPMPTVQRQLKHQERVGGGADHSSSSSSSSESGSDSSHTHSDAERARRGGGAAKLIKQEAGADGRVQRTRHASPDNKAAVTGKAAAAELRSERDRAKHREEDRRRTRDRGDRGDERDRDRGRERDRYREGDRERRHAHDRDQGGGRDRSRDRDREAGRLRWYSRERERSGDRERRRERYRDRDSGYDRERERRYERDRREDRSIDHRSKYSSRQVDDRGGRDRHRGGDRSARDRQQRSSDGRRDRQHSDRRGDAHKGGRSGGARLKARRKSGDSTNSSGSSSSSGEDSSSSSSSESSSSSSSQ